jgi:hypothetical protein
MQDRPTYAELLDAVRHFLEVEVVPRLDGPRKFHARVAANVLAIVERELKAEDGQLRAEYDRLAKLLASSEPVPSEREPLRKAIREQTKRLGERIAAGEADAGDWRKAVLAHARATVREKLEVANPRYLEGDDKLRRKG